MSVRNFTSHETFGPYTHISDDTGETLISPFPVAAIGVNREILGMGILVGGITDEIKGRRPVIAIQDEGQVVELLGDNECDWMCTIDEDVLMLLSLVKVQRRMMRASRYLESLEDGSDEQLE
ncbi:MAG TPA: hypothetical protein VLE69_00515 [Candidatus Saccharimonadales bacterium]|nr:hypothetical protein [Candidatus Saccharimonadales bacterium]